MSFPGPLKNMISPLTLRPPSKYNVPRPTKSEDAYTPHPEPGWMIGKWHVTHSSFPFWKKDKRNVTFNYEPMPNSLTKVRDTVQYQNLKNDKIQSFNGVDTPSRDDATGAWDWRGSDWYTKFLKSHWEILASGEGAEGEKWMVIWFDNTLFTPTGIDILCRRPEGLSQETAKAVHTALKEIESDLVKTLINGLVVLPIGSIEEVRELKRKEKEAQKEREAQDPNSSRNNDQYSDRHMIGQWANAV